MKSMRDIINRLRLIGEESSEQEATDEVIMLSTVAVRLAVTNKAVILMLREKDTPMTQWYMTAVSDELRLLRDEKLADADWLRTEIKIASGRAGRGRDGQDFRSVDVKHLKHRRAVLQAVAERLIELSEDEEYLTSEAEGCLERTREEVQTAIQEIATRSVHPDPYLTEEERDKRLDVLRRDLSDEILRLARD
jgi:hypothetical protein